MRKPAELWSVQLLRKNLQAHLTARENAERQRRAHLPQNIINKVTVSPPRRSSAEALMVGTNPKANHVQTRQLANKMYVYCQGNHWSDECPRYQTIIQKKERIKGRCFICFGSQHLLRECPSDRQCIYCKCAHNHHRSLCPEKFPKGENEAATVISEERPVVQVNDASMQMQDNEAKTGNETKTASAQTNTEDACLTSGENVLLQTATTDIKNPQNNWSIKARVLLDPGSHRTYVTEKLANILELKRLEKEITSVVTFGSSKPKQIQSHVVSIELPLKDGTSFNLLANVIPEITSFIQCSPLQIGKTAFLWKDLSLADFIPTEKEVSTIELLIGRAYNY